MACDPTFVFVPGPARPWFHLTDAELTSELSLCDYEAWARWNARRFELGFLLPIPLSIFARSIGARRRGTAGAARGGEADPTPERQRRISS